MRKGILRKDNNLAYQQGHVCILGDWVKGEGLDRSCNCSEDLGGWLMPLSSLYL